MKKRILTVLISGLLATSLLASCADSGKDAPPQAESSKATAADTTKAKDDEAKDTDATASADDSDFPGYPMDAQDQTITWFSGPSYVPNAAYASADESPFHTGLEEMLGVNIEWQFPTAGTEAEQAFQLMMAGGTLPDIINHTLMKDAERYIDEGTIYDLSPYIQEHSPAYYAWLQTNSDYDKSMKTDNGKYYGYGFFREDGGWNDTYQGPVVNKAWLDELNLELPKTISDWDQVLEAFKDEYGVALSFARNRVEPTGISGAFGAYGMITYALYIDGNDNVQLPHVQPEYKDYVTKLNEWWEAGYLDHDFMTVEDTPARSNAMNLNMGISYTSMGQLSNWTRDAEENDTGAEWVGLQYPTGDDGTLSMVFGGRGIGDVAGVISTSCPEEKIPLVMRALDYAYTEEGNLYWNFGKQGVSWDYNDKNEVEYLPLVTEDPNGINDAIDKFGGSTWSGNCIQATRLLYLKNTDVSIAANDMWFYENETVATNWRLPNGITLTPDESLRNAELQGTIQTYIQEMAAKFITGEESIDNFDDFVSTVEGMGLAELLEINQAGYDRYLAR